MHDFEATAGPSAPEARAEAFMPALPGMPAGPVLNEPEEAQRAAYAEAMKPSCRDVHATRVAPP